MTEKETLKESCSGRVWYKYTPKLPTHVDGNKLPPTAEFEEWFTFTDLTKYPDGLADD
jgi:hypothetical protein